MIQTTEYVPDSNTEPNSRLSCSHALVIALIGPPGSGKTAFIEATARQLGGKVRLAVIIVNPAAERDAERISRCCKNVQAIKTAHPDTVAILPALAKLPMDQIDLLLIESMGGLTGAPNFQQDHTACVLSVSGGDDKAAEYSDLLAQSSVVILSKAELQQHVMFNRRTFGDDLARINPTAELIDISAFENTGMDRWLAWLQRRCEEKHPKSTARDFVAPDWYVG